MFCCRQMCHIITFLAAFKVAGLTFIYLAFFWHFIVSLASVFDSMKYLHIKIAKQPTQKNEKNYAVNLKLFFSYLQHYAAKLIFHIFQKKKWPRFSKMDIFKMSIFGKSQHKFIQWFYVGPCFVGYNYVWVGYCRPTFWKPRPQFV